MKLSKGDITRNKIYEYAKESFYKNGYKNTTITGICNELDIALGNITYYFKKKDNIATQVIKDFLAVINDCVEEFVDGEQRFFYRHFLVSYIYYNIILNDKRNRKFYGELLQKEPLFQVMPPAVEYTYDGFMGDFGITMTPMQRKVLIASDLGSRREIVLGYMAGQFKMPVGDLVVTLLLNTGRLVGLPEIEMYKMAYLAYVDAKNLKFNHIKLLV